MWLPHLTPGQCSGNSHPSSDLFFFGDALVWKESTKSNMSTQHVVPIFAEFSSLPKREWIRSSFPAAQGPIVGLSLSAIAIRRQKHLCAYRHLIGSPRCCFNVTLLKGEKGKLRSSKKTPIKKTKDKRIVCCCFRDSDKLIEAQTCSPPWKTFRKYVESQLLSMITVPGIRDPSTKKTCYVQKTHVPQSKLLILGMVIPPK